MAVDASVRRQVEKRLLEDLPERDDGDHVRPPRADPRHRLVVVHPLRLDDLGDAAGLRILRERTRRELLPAPDRTVRLGDDSDDLEALLAQQRAKALRRSRGRSHENNPHIWRIL